MSYLDWHVGMKVVCVSADWDVTIRLNGVALGIPSRQPMIDEVLTIAGIVPGSGDYGTGREDGVFLEFMEIPLHQSENGSGFDFRWGPENFRPLQARKTDISIFEKILTGSKQKEPV